MDSCGKNNFLSTLQKLSTDDLEVIIKTQQKVGNILKYDEWLGEKLEPEEVSNFKLKVGDLQPEYPCSVQFASGTTGQSKAALTSHFNMINEAIYMGKALNMDKAPKLVCLTVPMFLAFGFGVISAAMNYGCTLYLPNPTFNATASLETIEKYRCQVVMGTPTMFVGMVDTQKRLHKDISSLELALMGGSACSPEVIQRTRQVFEISNVRVGYELSEVSGGIYVNDDTQSPDKAMFTCGKLCDHGKTLKFGEVGELLVRGWFTMMVYFGDETNTKKAIDSNGWFKTG